MTDEKKQLLELTDRICKGRPALVRDKVYEIIAEAFKLGAKKGFEDGVEYSKQHQETQTQKDT